MEARKQVTVWCTYGLVIMSVIFAIVGFATGNKGFGQIAALTMALLLFTWFLSETLETYLEHRRQNNWRQWTTGGLGLFMLFVEIHLVHFGIAWLFPELGETTHYLISAGFSAMTVCAKASFGYTYPDKPEPVIKKDDSELADILESVGGTTLIDATEDTPEPIAVTA